MSEFNLTKDIVIDYLGAGWKDEKVRKLFEVKDSIFTQVKNGLLPPEPMQEGGVLGLINRLKKSSYLTRFIDKIGLKFYPAIKPDIVMLGGEAGYSDLAVQAPRFQIPAHSFDYDVFLNLKQPIEHNEGKYAVFLDEDIVYHSDYVHLRQTPPVKAKGILF